ncbi:hypothetical protein [Acidithiobacillus caldus]|uniref:hypothetical protein n=1 Tax=Acidithiobacillus caldus TaxID=33059 RepID=UPI001C0698FC|nr:hypothetical protein [Acidithiobacillus caldus]MBU2762230.1 dihydroxy-acid dehydratase [Acidithiobacillus caldus]MBU2770498.1 dihydroxy-acid dehydratase [Acidithiobacillus caldus]
MAKIDRSKGLYDEMEKALDIVLAKNAAKAQAKQTKNVEENLQPSADPAPAHAPVQTSAPARHGKKKGGRPRVDVRRHSVTVMLTPAELERLRRAWRDESDGRGTLGRYLRERLVGSQRSSTR